MLSEGIEEPKMQSPNVEVQKDKHAASLQRNKVAVARMSRREAFEELQVDTARSLHEIRQKNRMIAIKCYAGNFSDK